MSGFSEIGTGGRDYGQGVVRITKNAFTAQELGTFMLRRNNLLKLSRCDNGKTTFAFFRPLPDSTLAEPTNQPKIFMEYDDRLQLDVFDKGDVVELEISPAGLLGRLSYFTNHPNILVRTNAYLSLTLTGASILLAIALTFFTMGA